MAERSYIAPSYCSPSTLGSLVSPGLLSPAHAACIPHVDVMSSDRLVVVAAAAAVAVAAVVTGIMHRAYTSDVAVLRASVDRSLQPLAMTARSDVQV